MFFILNLSFCDAILLLKFGALRKDTDMNIRELLKDKTETYFRGTTDKNPLTYAAGERMFFTVTFYADGEAVKLPWGKITIDGDDGSHEDFCMQPDENGVFTIETSLARDGYIKVIIQACDEDKQIIESAPLFEGGAGADIDRIRCETDEPCDYLAFWDRLKSEAAAIEPEIIFEKDIALRKDS